MPAGQRMWCFPSGRTSLLSWGQFCAPQSKRHLDILERDQLGVTEGIKGLEHLSLRRDWELGLEKRRLRGDLLMNKNTWSEGGHRTNPGSAQWTKTSRGCGHKLGHRRFPLNIREHFFFIGMGMEPWNGLPREFVESPSLEIFKICLDTALGNVLGGPVWAGGLDQRISRFHFQHQPLSWEIRE